MDMQTKTEAHLVPIAEGASRVGRNVKTLRRWIAAGTISAYREPGSGRIYVDTAEVEAAVTPIPVRHRIPA